jgi:hypothetical protein
LIVILGCASAQAGAHAPVSGCRPFWGIPDATWQTSTPLVPAEEIGTPEVIEFFKHVDSPPSPVSLIDGDITLQGLPRAATVEVAGECNTPDIDPVCPLNLMNRLAPDLVPGHGNGVLSLIAGPDLLAAGIRAKLVSPERARILNMSLVVRDDTDGDDDRAAKLKFFTDYVRPDALIVKAAGNDFPAAIPEDEAALAVIHVGNLEVDGYMSPLSREHGNIVISVPSGEHTVALDRDGLLVVARGDSFATPRASGALANVDSLIPGFTLAQAKELLKRTAIPVSGTEDGRRVNGWGSLNAYLLVRVAERLRRYGWPRDAAEIEDSATYDFGEEALRHWREARGYFALRTCLAETTGVRELRQAFFLAPQNRPLREELSAVYSAYGFNLQAKFYGNPDLRDPRIQRRRRETRLGK